MQKMNWQTFWTAGGVVLTIVSALIASFGMLNNSINKLNDKMDNRFNMLNVEIQDIKERLTVIETTLILKGIMSRDLAFADSNYRPRDIP